MIAFRNWTHRKYTSFKDKFSLVELLSLGLNLPNYDDLKLLIRNSNEGLINISEYITNNQINFNASFLNIIRNSNILWIKDSLKDNEINQEIYLTWDSNCLAEIKHSFNPNISSLMLRNILSEDDVTYSSLEVLDRLTEAW